MEVPPGPRAGDRDLTADARRFSCTPAVTFTAKGVGAYDVLCVDSGMDGAGTCGWGHKWMVAKGAFIVRPPDRAGLVFRANWRYTVSQIGSVAMISTARLVETLGGRRIIKGRPLSDEAVIERVRSGLPFSALEAIATHFEIPQERLVRVLALPLRTLARRKKERRLRADESDRLIRLALIATLAEEVLGSREKAVAWLQKPNRALQGVNPLDRLDTGIGEQQVEQLLSRIAHGVYS